MIAFLAKGILRDKTRSLFPLLIVSLMVTLIIFFKGFMLGVMNSVINDTAIISTGYLKVTTKAYDEEKQLLPNDLALLDIENLINNLNKEYPEYFWTPRITFAGLLDVPNEKGETLKQGPTIALGIDLFSTNSRQIEMWDLDKKLRSGRLPSKPNEVLFSTKLANRLSVEPGMKITFIGATMHGAFGTYNFNLVGTFSLEMGPVDKDMMLLDISGAQIALDMENAASEILGFTHELQYKDDESISIRKNYNIMQNREDIFSPFMLALRDFYQMGAMLDLQNAAMAVILTIFLLVVTIVLWNIGLMNGLRRYGEIGMRLAIGESKGGVYRSMVMESVIIGFIGTFLGTSLGLAITYYMQEYGIDYSKGLENLTSTNIVISNVFYAQVTPDLYYIGFIPGVLATVLGTMLAGRAIYKREMAQLFKELET
tara:strand:- start:282 stop:1562 length:1281 start_codon:yes stop_codon:yes gene_type:complete